MSRLDYKARVGSDLFGFVALRSYSGATPADLLTAIILASYLKFY